MARQLPNNQKTAEFQDLDRRVRVGRMYLQGKTMMAIAGELGVNVGTVGRDIQAIRKEWLSRVVEDYNERKAAEVARIDHLEAKAWEAWERSTQDAEVITKRVEMVPQRAERQKGNRSHAAMPESPGMAAVVLPQVAVRTVEETTKKPQVGDPRFMQQIAWCIEQRCKIWGLYKDNGTTVNNTVVVRWDELVGEGPRPSDQIEDRIASIETQDQPSLPAPQPANEE